MTDIRTVAEQQLEIAVEALRQIGAAQSEWTGYGSSAGKANATFVAIAALAAPCNTGESRWLNL
jgi:hypothetical protein